MTGHLTPGPLARLLVLFVRAYQRTSLLRQPRCRFHPTCSSYAVEALRVHGSLRGSLLAIRRIGRCHPWNPGGVDHVPPARTRAGVRPTSSPTSSDHPPRIPS